MANVRYAPPFRARLGDRDSAHPRPNPKAPGDPPHGAECAYSQRGTAPSILRSAPRPRDGTGAALRGSPTLYQSTMNLSAPICGFLPEAASFCPRSVGTAPAEPKEKRPPHLYGGRALYHNDCYQGTPATLVTASIFAEVAGNCQQRCSISFALYHRRTEWTNNGESMYFSEWLP